MSRFKTLAGTSGDTSPPQRGDLLDQAGGQEAVLRVGRHEQGVHAGQAAVHLGHLQFVVEVADGPQTLDDHRDLVGAAVVHDQALERVDPNVAVRRGHLGEHLAAFLDGEQARLRLVHEHRDDYLVVERGGPPDDVEVPVRDGIERAGTDRPPDRGAVRVCPIG